MNKTWMVYATTVAALLVYGEGCRADEGTSRTFSFVYSAKIEGMPPGERARIWMPVAPSNDEQSARIVRQSVPGSPRIGNDTRFGNTILYTEARADAKGCVDLSLTYQVTRKTVTAQMVPVEMSLNEDDALYLRPDTLVPIGGKPAMLIGNKNVPADPMERARMFYNLVDAHMTYGQDTPGLGRGDANWACENKVGNSTDFHALFIALARTYGIPAKFEIGFAVPDKKSVDADEPVAGYHSWAKFKPAGRGWVPVDISEANQHPELKDHNFGTLNPDRILFTQGRDLMLVPKQDGPPVNFLVYPYVEVGRQAWPQEKIKMACRYRDLPEAKMAMDK